MTVLKKVPVAAIRGASIFVVKENPPMAELGGRGGAASGASLVSQCTLALYSTQNEENCLRSPQSYRAVLSPTAVLFLTDI